MALAGLLFSTSIASAGVLYVRTTGNDATSGISWALAKQTIPNAIAAASAGDQIWIASGVYTQLVTLKPSVALYGGFNGTETSFAQRNYGTNFAILDARSQGTVITITNAGLDTRIDGVVITGGLGIHGGGIAIDVAAPTIINNFITRNTANGGAGAGIFINGYLVVSNAQPVIFNNTIYRNVSLGDNGDGGGIAMGGSSPLIGYNRILGNFAGHYAGGVGCWKDCHAIIVNNTIEGNAAGTEATIGLGGGVFASAKDFDGQFISDVMSAPVIINNVIAANGAPAGGGIALADSNTGTPTVGNNTIIGNTGSGIYWANAFPSNCNNLIAFNSTGLERLDASPTTLKNNDVYGNNVLGGRTDYVGLPDATGANGNISAEPKLANYQIGNFRLQPDSPCVNAGLTAAVVSGYPDADINTRVIGAAVDIGAYESTGATLNAPTPIIYVSPSGNDANAGVTWAAAKRTVQSGISAAAAPLMGGGEVWVAQGTYLEHINLPPFVYVYGGFTGTETTRAARNFVSHPTVLDGGGQPTIVLSQGAGYLLSALDGFTVQDSGTFTGGQTPGTTHNGLGGAINCTVSSPIIANNLIVSNSLGSPFGSLSPSLGSGIYCYESAPQIIGNTFYRNEVLDITAGRGGGIYVTSSKPTIQGNVFTQNYARDGAAIFANVSSVRLVGNTIQANTFYNNGLSYMGARDGAVFLDGCQNFLIEGNVIRGNAATVGAGLDVQSGLDGQVRNNLVLTNSAFDPQSSGLGGGIYCQSFGNVQILNNTVVGNTATGLLPSGGVGLSAFTNGAIVFANNIVAFNSSGIFLYPGSAAPTLRNNCVTNASNYNGLSPGVGDVNADPQLTNPSVGDYRLLASSPCIDAGFVPNAPPTDFNGIARPLDGNNDGTPAFDIGASEFVHPAGDTDHDGMSDQNEIIAGTSPIDAASLLKLQARQISGNTLALNWSSVTGRTYSIQFKPTLSAAWQILSNNIPGTGLVLEVQDSLLTASRFYQVQVSK